MRKLGTALIPLMLVAGCSGNDNVDPTDNTQTTPATSVNLEVRSDLPQWNLGQGWTYRVERPGLPTETFKMVAAEDREGLWVVASNNRTQAVNHAVYSTNPMLGRIGKDTLSPYQSGSPVKMYQFPLTDGQTWSATFFGQTMSFQATYVGDIDSSQINAARNLPKRLDGFRITATGGGQSVSYDYVEAVTWFTAFELRDENGAREFRLSLSDFESDYKGQYFFYRGAPDSDALIQEGAHAASDIPPTTSETYEANVPSGFKDLVALGVVYVGKTANVPNRLELWLQKPDGSTAMSQPFGGAREIHFLKEVPGVDGKWSLQANMTGTLTFEARVFGISKYAEGTI